MNRDEIIQENNRTFYQIQVKGHLSSTWSTWFEDFTMVLKKSGETVLTGSVPDQAALHGLLKKIRDIGLPLISLTPMGVENTKISKQNTALKKEKQRMLQKAGAFSAFYLAAAYIIGIVLFLVVLDYPSIVDPMQKLELLTRQSGVIYLTNLIMYVFFGVFLVILNMSVYRRMKDNVPGPAKLAAGIGIIWAASVIASGMVHNAGIAPALGLYRTDPGNAALYWLGIETVANGLGGANGEVLGGLWTLFISAAALYVKSFSKVFCWLGLIVGSAGLISAVPGLHDFTGIFGITQIIWFIWLGIALLTLKEKRQVEE
ncbi:MAG: hypothetical protein ACLFR1_01385 [Spirochaetia bacterium]